MTRVGITSLVALVAVGACSAGDDAASDSALVVGDTTSGTTAAAPMGDANSASSARAVLRDAQGAEVGTVRMRPTDAGVEFAIELVGMPAGAHGIHVHETGDCTPPGFTSAGGHFNPEGRQHGTEDPDGAHAGDLPNVTVQADGTGSLTTTNSRVTLADGATSLFKTGGTAIVVHAGPDDYRTDPSGDSGDRLACGVVERG